MLDALAHLWPYLLGAGAGGSLVAWSALTPPRPRKRLPHGSSLSARYWADEAEPWATEAEPSRRTAGR